LAGRPSADHSENQRDVADQSIVGAEDSGPQSAGKLCSAARGQPSYYLAMDQLVGCDRRRHVRIREARPALGPFHQREYEHPAEPAGKQSQQPCAHVRPSRPADLLTEQSFPVCGVTLLCVGQPKQDLALLATAACRQLPIGACRLPFLGQHPSPPPEGRRRPSGHGRHLPVTAHDLNSPRQAGEPSTGHPAGTPPDAPALA
jgi:hypothetical protein